VNRQVCYLEYDRVDYPELGHTWVTLSCAFSAEAAPGGGSPVPISSARCRG